MTIGYDGLPPSYIGQGSPLTPNLGLSLFGVDPVVAENFWLIDLFASGSSVFVNSASVSNPNFNDTTPAAAVNHLNVTWHVSGSNVSASIDTTSIITAPAAPTTSVQFNNSGVFGGSANFEYDSTNTILSVGASPTSVQIGHTPTGPNPTDVFELHSETTNIISGQYRVGAMSIFGHFNNSGPVINIGRSNGTRALPTALGSGDVFARFDFLGYDGAAYLPGAAINIQTSEIWSGTNKGTEIVFQQVPNGSTVIAEVMRITSPQQLQLHLGIPLTWNGDAGFSRLGAASLALGNGTDGDFTGALKLRSVFVEGAGQTGAATNVQPLEIHNTANGIAAFYVHSSGNGPTLNFASSTGTEGSPTATTGTQFISFVNFRGYDGSAYQNGAQISVQAQALWSGSNRSTTIEISTVRVGTTALVEALRIGSTVDSIQSSMDVGVLTGKTLGFFPTSVNTANDTAFSRLGVASVALGNGTNGDFTGTLKLTILNSVTGYQVNGAAVSGNYLRGNGTNFVSSTIQIGDLPSGTVSGSGTTNTFPVWSGTSTLADNTIIATQGAATVDAATALILTPGSPSTTNAILEVHNQFGSGIDLFTQAAVGNLGRCANIHFYKSHGASLAASPLAVSALGDALGIITFGGYNGTAYSQNGCKIETDATEAWTSSAQGSAFTFFSNANGTINLNSCLIRLAGTSSSFPAIKRSSANVNFRLADDSADTGIIASIVNATTGFQVSGAATSGNVLRGNGTNFVSAQLAYSDLSGTPQLPQTIAAVTSNWLRSYSSVTGLFTASQPAFTDVSGTASANQYVTMIGDSGSGGTKGAVPAPASGDAAAAKFLKADGTWGVPAGAGSGSVTSVSMTGDGVIFNATVGGSPITVSGTLVPALLTQTANTVLSGPTSGGAATPAFRALVAADIPNSTITPIWNNLQNATGALTLANAGNATTFNQTSAVTWMWANTTAATSSVSQSSPILNINGKYWDGAASQTDSWTMQDIIANGTNGASTFTLAHTGSSGLGKLNVTGAATLSFPSWVIQGSPVSIPNENTQGFIVAATGHGAAFIGGATVQGYGLVFANSSVFTNVTQTQFGIQYGATFGFLNATGSSTTFNSSPTAGSVKFVGLGVNPTINQTSAATGNYTGLQINAQEVAFLGTTALLGDFQISCPITNASESAGSVVTLTVVNNKALAGQTVTLEGLNTFTWLNGQVVSLTTASATSLTFTDPTTHGTQASVAQVGRVSLSQFTINTAGIHTIYAGSTLVGQGIPSEIITVDLTGQTAAIAATNLTASAPRTGMYRISASATITTAGSTSSVLGGTNGFQIGFTSPTDSVAKTTVPGNSITTAANTTGTAISDSIVVYAKTGTAITYAFDYTSVGVTAMAYELHVRLEAM